MRIKCTRGFTLPEVIVAVAIVALIAVISAASFVNYNRAAAIRIANQEVVTALIDARNDTLSSKGDTVYGVHVGDTSITRFTGAIYSSTSPSNEIVGFAGDVIATTSLTGGAIDIIFQRLTGIPSATGTISLLSQNSSSSRIITVHGTGLVE